MEEGEPDAEYFVDLLNSTNCIKHGQTTTISQWFMYF